MITAAEAFPLKWPEGVPRTQNPENNRRIDTTIERSARMLDNEVRRMGGGHVVISSNIQTRLDGRPYSNAAQPKDMGVAVYFMLDGSQKCFACDRWNTVAQNLWAIMKTIEALRGIERWGSSEIMKRAFAGFAALPPASGPVEIPWHVTLQMPSGFETAPKAMVLDFARRRYETLAFNVHPDRNPDSDGQAMVSLNKAWEQAQAELKE